MERHQDMTGRCRHLRDCSFERTMQSLCRRRGRRDGLGRGVWQKGCEREGVARDCLGRDFGKDLDELLVRP